MDTIHDLAIHFNQTFPPVWLNYHNWDDEKSSETSAEIALKVIEDFKIDVFIVFSKSLLKGEYILNPHILDELESFSKDLTSRGRIETDNKHKNHVHAVLNKTTREVSFLIDSYRQFILNLSNKYRLENHHFLVSAFSTLGRNEEISPILKIFILHELFVYILEHNFARSEENIRHLIFTKASLEKERDNYPEQVQVIIDLFINRCHFLLIKLLNDEKEIEYLLDFKRYNLPKQTKDESVNSLLSDFQFYCRDSYSQDEVRVRSIQNKVLAERPLSFQEYVLLLKYYKDSSLGTKRQFDNVVGKFEERYKDILPKFGERNYDTFALKTLKNYIYNCRFSFIIENEKSKSLFDVLKEEMAQIETIQDETGIFNFYPFKKAVRILLSDIRRYLHSKDYDENGFNQRYSSLKNYFKRYCSAVKWCKESSFFPILNLHKDCCKYHRELGFKVFYPSSYSRYVDYESLEEDIADIEQEIRIIDSEKSIKVELQQLENIKEEIEGSKRSFFEIFGIFTGVIALVFGGINLFSERDIPTTKALTIEQTQQLYSLSLSHRTIDFLSFGSCLILFVALIYFISLPREKHFKSYFSYPKFWIFLILLLASMSYVAVSLLR